MAIQSTNDLKAARGASERRAQQEFERLYARTRRRAYHFAYRLTRNATEAEDVTQDAYARAWYHFDRYDSARPFEGWLFRIIANRVIDLRRRQKRIQICSLDTPPRLDSDGLPLSGHVFAAPNSDPEQIVVGPILAERLQQALEALPADYRTALLLCDVEQRPYLEIAETMGCALGTVRSRIHRARGMLHDILESEAPGEAGIAAWQRSRQPRTTSERAPRKPAR